MAAIRAQMAGARVVLVGGSPGASDRMAGFSTALSDHPQDQPSALFNDMFVGGGFVNNPAVVAAMAERVGPETRFLVEMGLPFERKGDKLARRQAAGTTWTRAVYSLGMIGVDIGKEIEKRLKEAANPPVTLLQGGLLLDLRVVDGAVQGGLVYMPKQEAWVQVSAPAVVVATGGAGRLFGSTTNPPGSRGTGYALGLEAGAPLVDMEFVSFEPFVMASPAKVRSMELPTTVLREGCRLLNGRGEEFMDTSQAPSKDVICRAMLAEVAEGRGTENSAVYYDLTGMVPEVALQYSQIRRVLRVLGLKPEEAKLEVMPAQHYLMGGIRTDERATSDVPGLWAVGEVAGGAHGAHRLATCGGTEVVAMGAIAGEAAAAFARERPLSGASSAVEARPELLQVDPASDDQARLARVAAALDAGCGILRDGEGLSQAVAELRQLNAELARADRLVTFAGRAASVALTMAETALLRTESRGDHFRTDFPRRDDVRWLGNLLVRREKGADLTITYEKAGIAQRNPVPLPGR
jgi:succinate dehydrogenase/fumarate reductase flavoprotein subunit